jgi:hypothetical protein
MTIRRTRTRRVGASRFTIAAVAQTATNSPASQLSSEFIARPLLTPSGAAPSSIPIAALETPARTGDARRRSGDAGAVRPLALVVTGSVLLHGALAHAQAGPVAPRPDAPPMAPHRDLMKSEIDMSGSPATEPSVDRTRLVLGAGAHAALGPAPAAAVGVDLTAELANYRWSLGLEGRYDLPASAPTTAGARARASLAGFQLVPCMRAQGMWACAVVLVANVHASAARAPEPSVHDDLLLVGVGARLAVHLSLPADFALRVGGQLLAHPVSLELTQGGSRLFRSSAVSATLGPTIVRVF